MVRLRPGGAYRHLVLVKVTGNAEGTQVPIDDVIARGVLKVYARGHAVLATLPQYVKNRSFFYITGKEGLDCLAFSVLSV